MKKRFTEEQIRSGMQPNLCRCGTHMRIVRAIERAGREMGARKPGASS